MDRKQESEWAAAQNIFISEDLIAAAKKQLTFLAAVERKPYLYDGPALERAIFRYKYCWLPLLAKHVESQISEGPLVVPLDCEWIWHCHRLNPVRYKNDCEELFGKILDNCNVESSVQGVCRKQTKEIWNRMYPDEPYELDVKSNFSIYAAESSLGASQTTNYDLVSAVKRQSSFFYQVSKPYMIDYLYLKGSVARYKGFLHLIKKNKERSIPCFSVPTYDIDLIWHSHQLHPVSYCNDLKAILGEVLEHDDTDSDRSKGKKLDIGFSATTKQWEDTFGLRYWRAGAMYRGSAPSPLPISFSKLNSEYKKLVSSYDHQSIIKLPSDMLVEVMMELVQIRGLPSGHESGLAVILSKESDVFFKAKKALNIASELGEKQITALQCEPTGEFTFQLISTMPAAIPPKTLGTVSISLQTLLASNSQLITEKWFDMVPSSGYVGPEPVSLRIAVSLTPPMLASHTTEMAVGICDGHIGDSVKNMGHGACGYFGGCTAKCGGGTCTGTCKGCCNGGSKCSC